MKYVFLFIYSLSISLYAQESFYNPEKSKDKLYKYAEFSNVGKLDFNIQEVINNSNLEYKNLKS